MGEILVGLAGYGVGGAVFHAPLLEVTLGLRLAAVATSRREGVEQALPGARVTATYRELIADPTLGLIVVSTPTASHFEIAKAALESGKNVVVDKPFTTTAAEAGELIALARRRGLLLSVYQNRRWDGDFLTVERLVKEGQLGHVYHYESHFDRFRPRIKGGWRDEEGAGSGILYDLGAHLIDQALRLFGLPRAVWAEAMAQRPEARSVDYFHVVLDYGRLRAILHGASVVREPGPRFAVHGDGGSFLKSGMDPQEDALRAGARPGAAGWGEDSPENYGLLVRAEGERQRVRTAAGSYTSYYDGIARALLEGSPVPVDPADSRDGLRVIEAASKSAAEGRRVTLTD